VSTPTGVAITDLRTPPAPLRHRTVLVPLDCSRLAERALGTAGWLARRFDAELHVITADIGRDEAWWYGRYLDALVEHQPDITPHRSDDPDVARAVRAMAAELAPAVVCVATHGRSPGAAVIHSTFAAIARASVAPVIAIGPGTRTVVDEASGRIVACVDGTSASETVLPATADWARRLGLRLSIVTAAEPTPPPIVPSTHRHRAHGPDLDPDGYIGRLMQRPELAGLDVDGTVIWDPISPHAGILDHLDQHPATMLAVTSHARAGIARAVLGGEAARIIHASPVPVLVHPATRP
jgi:nucleotide-binding universal stress UspA family protein